MADCRPHIARQKGVIPCLLIGAARTVIAWNGMFRSGADQSVTDP
ncbi:MAG: hypothetical protein AAGE61_19460 [Pseudomonadota bacterium]